MTLDDVIRAMCEEAQPFLDRDKPNPPEVSTVIDQTKRLFAEQPNIQNAFVAIVGRLVNEARKGWTEDAKA